MRHGMFFPALFITASALALGAIPQTDNQDKVSYRVVKYAGLAETINKHKGKVILVDFWAEW